MTNSEQNALDAAVEHAQRYKELFHSMQDNLALSQDEVVRRGAVIAKQKATIARQGRIIADLEKRLGVDQDL
jgi:hypothetical protein